MHFRRYVAQRAHGEYCVGFVVRDSCFALVIKRVKRACEQLVRPARVGRTPVQLMRHARVGRVAMFVQLARWFAFP